MLCKIGEEFPGEEEINLYVNRLHKIYASNPQNLLGVQLYGVVRHTAIPDVHPIEKSFFSKVAEKIREKVPVEIDLY
jgi:hypothetical protein